jgi:hypothetical protein
MTQGLHVAQNAVDGETRGPTLRTGIERVLVPGTGQIWQLISHEQRPATKKAEPLSGHMPENTLSSMSLPPVARFDTGRKAID